MQPRHSSQFAAALAFAAAGLFSASAAADAPFTDVHVFGDSLSDGGNIFLATGGLTGPDPTDNTFIPSAPYVQAGTFSNGPTWFAPFAAGLGLAGDATPSLGGGGNHAWGGARMAIDGPGLPPSVQAQLGMFLGGGGSFSAGSLVVLAGGGNDVRDVGMAIAGGADPTTAIMAGASLYATATLNMVNTLRSEGVDHIVVWNVPDVGKTPASLAGGATVAGTASFISDTFNAALSSTLAGSGVKIFDTFGLIGGIVADPASFGYSNVVDACGAAVNACDPASALFWDGIHPTAYTQTLIAGQMLAAVPEPATYAMFAFGLAGLLAWSRRRAA